MAEAARKRERVVKMLLTMIARINLNTHFAFNFENFQFWCFTFDSQDGNKTQRFVHTLSTYSHFLRNQNHP